MWMNFFLVALIAKPALPEMKADTSAVKSTLIAADEALARETARAGSQAFLRMLEPGAAVLFPGQPILRGPSEARAAFVSRYGSPSTFTWRPVHALASTDGRFGCTMGYSRFVNAADTSKAERRGVYVTCWRRGTDGRWHIAGTQRNDTPDTPPTLADSATLPGGPHSATVSFEGNALIGAQDADSLFAVFGAQPSGPGPAFARYAAEDGMLISGGDFPRGVAQIVELFKGYSPDRVITWRPMRNLGAGSGGLAFTVGHAVSGPRPGKTGQSRLNKYLTVWRQDPNGQWKYVFDIGTSRE